MNDKIIVCRCEDVTLAEIHEALTLGCQSIDEVKRLTGLGTGPCQGKECQAHVGRLLEAGGARPAALKPFTARPPFSPTPLRLFAGLGGKDRGP